VLVVCVGSSVFEIYITIGRDREQVNGAAMATSYAMTLAGQPSELGFVIGGPCHPGYAMETDRLRSFKHFPLGCPVRPADIASAGFFYTGNGDAVRCFYCDMGLREWAPGDTPWEEHARWYPLCTHLRVRKGEAFVKGVQEKYGQWREYNSGAISQLRGVHVDVPSSGLRAPFEGAAGQGGDVVGVGTAEHEQEQEVEEQQKQVQELGSVAAVPPDPGHDVETSGCDCIAIKEQNRQLKEQLTCKVCLQNEVQTAFLPCGHAVCCLRCIPAFNKCPLCRHAAIGKVRIFIS
jgi:baculoviral IAP repeat-containing protein 7/8